MSTLLTLTQCFTECRISLPRPNLASADSVKDKLQISSRSRLLWLVFLLGLCTCPSAAQQLQLSVTTPGITGPYFTTPFVVEKNSFDYPQDPAWSNDGAVLFHRNDENGISQIYKSALDGSGRHCLTCNVQKGPNGLPQERPQGDWILFESYGDQLLHFGNPGLGGYGGDLYVVLPDGSKAVRLTRESDPNQGEDFSKNKKGTPYDNYHAYWSPDGSHIIWTRVSAFTLKQGGAKWEIMLGDFAAGNPPHLENIRVVGPAFGIYETQPWAPDGSGFVFFASGGRNSPYQSNPPGWGQANVYFMRLYGADVSPEHPRVTNLTHDLPVYMEQAIFTPDMKELIVMSAYPGSGTWYSEVAAAGARTGYDAPFAGSVGSLQFLADFSTPPFGTNLWMIDIKTGAMRPLTHFPSSVIPEFFWDRDYKRILWSQGDFDAKSGKSAWRTYIGSFPELPPVAPASTGTVPDGLYGEPRDMSRITKDPLGTEPISLIDVLKALPLVSKLAKAPKPPFGDKQGLPLVVVEYFLLWQKQLNELGRKAKTDIQNKDFISHVLAAPPSE